MNPCTVLPCIPRKFWLLSSLAFFTLPAWANPTQRPDIVGPVGFARGSTVTVYIDIDPKSKLGAGDPEKRDRVADAVKGVEGWTQPLKDIGEVTLKVVKLDGSGNDPATSKPPDLSASGSVHVVWESSDVIGKAKGGAGAYAEEPQASGDLDGQGHMTNANAASGGVVHLNSDATALPGKDQDLATRNAVHELGHVLGLDHSDVKAPSNVMTSKTELQPGNSTPTAEDLKELKNLYASASGSDAFHISVVALTDDLGNELVRYRYALHYLSGPDFGLFQVGLGANVRVSDVVVPDGWEWHRRGTVIGFDPSFLDGDVPYLNSLNSDLLVSFVANASPESQPGWAGGLIDVLGPQAVPEPAVGGLLGVAGLAALCSRRRRVSSH